MKNQFKYIVTLSVFVASLLLSAFPLAQVALAKGITTRIVLVHSATYPKATGAAKYTTGSQREFQVEVDHVKVLAGKTLNVFVDGKKVGSMLVNSLGIGHLNLDTALGNKVPLIKAGSKVVVKFGSVLVTSGTF